MLCTPRLFGRNLKKRQPPIVDLDKVIHKAAWKRLDIRGPCGPKNRFCKQKGLYLKTDWSFLSRKDVVESFDLVPDQVAIQPVQLYRTQFRNFSGDKQVFTFRAERQTVSNMEMTVQQGISIGGNLNFNFSLPTPDIPAGVGGCEGPVNPDHFKMTSALAGAQVTWNKSVTDKFSKSETLKWGVDSAVTLANGQRALASLSVLEATLVGIIKIRSDFKLTDGSGLVPVDVMSYDGDELVGMTEITAATICRGLEDWDLSDDGFSFSVRSTIQCKAVYGVEQVAAVRLLQPGEEEGMALEGPILLDDTRSPGRALAATGGTGGPTIRELPAGDGESNSRTLKALKVGDGGTDISPLIP